MGKFGPKKSKLSVLTENWYTWYLGSADSESGLRFLKFRPQNPFSSNMGQKGQSCPFFLKIGMHGILTMLIHIQTFFSEISFSEFPTLNPFLGKFGPNKSKLSSLAENWHTECLNDVNCYSDIIFHSLEP